MASPYWAVCATEVRREHVARTFLMMREYETFLPLIKRQGRVEPLFPNYLFLRIVSQWYSARWSVAVTRILMDGQSPARLADDVVSDIRRREVNGLVVLPRAPRLRPGQPVRIRKGAFEGIYGIYDSMSGRDREFVLLQLLGQQVKVSLPARDVVAADQEA
jgi:transcriptional antiterminator RfaH